MKVEAMEVLLKKMLVHDKTAAGSHDMWYCAPLDLLASVFGERACLDGLIILRTLSMAVDP